VRQLAHDTLPRPAAPNGGDDAAAIERSWREPDRFAEVFDRHHDEIHGYFARRLGAAADDLAAETFLIAFDRRLRYDLAYRSARPWCGICRPPPPRRAALHRALSRTAPLAGYRTLAALRVGCLRSCCSNPRPMPP
jgi:hypothetical protein